MSPSTVTIHPLPVTRLREDVKQPARASFGASDAEPVSPRLAKLSLKDAHLRLRSGEAVMSPPTTTRLQPGSRFVVRNDPGGFPQVAASGKTRLEVPARRPARDRGGPDILLDGHSAALVPWPRRVRVSRGEPVVDLALHCESVRAGEDGGTHYRVPAARLNAAQKELLHTLEVPRRSNFYEIDGAAFGVRLDSRLAPAEPGEIDPVTLSYLDPRKVGKLMFDGVEVDYAGTLERAGRFLVQASTAAPSPWLQVLDREAVTRDGRTIYRIEAGLLRITAPEGSEIARRFAVPRPLPAESKSRQPEPDSPSGSLAPDGASRTPDSSPSTGQPQRIVIRDDKDRQRFWTTMIGRLQSDQSSFEFQLCGVELTALGVRQASSGATDIRVLVPRQRTAGDIAKELGLHVKASHRSGLECVMRDPREPAPRPARRSQKTQLAGTTSTSSPSRASTASTASKTLPRVSSLSPNSESRVRSWRKLKQQARQVIAALPPESRPGRVVPPSEPSPK